MPWSGPLGPRGPSVTPEIDAEKLEGKYLSAIYLSTALFFVAALAMDYQFSCDRFFFFFAPCRQRFSVPSVFSFATRGSGIFTRRLINNSKGRENYIESHASAWTFRENFNASWVFLSLHDYLNVTKCQMPWAPALSVLS